MKRPEFPSCHCVDVDFGTFANTVTMIAPFDLYDILGDKKSYHDVVIDTCIATEIGWLWHQGVKTSNSCCGHKKLRPSVVVQENSVNRMKELGYEIVDDPQKWANPHRTFYLNPKEK